jgi:hypothetical protein
MAFSPQPGAVRFTGTGMAAGTPGYMAPELWRGAEAGPRADVFSYGATLYEMLTGRLPQGNFPPAKKRRPEVPESVDRAILAALRPDPAERPPDMSAMLRALAKQPAITRRHLIVAGAAAVVAGGGGWWWRHRQLQSRGAGGKWKAIPWPQDPQAVAVSGGWRIEDGALLSDDRVCILPLAQHLPPSCKLRVRFTRLGGELSIGVFIRTHAGTGVCTLDGRGQHLGGVQSVNGEVLNPSNSFKFALENGRSYDWTIEVRPGRIRMWVDGALKDDRDVTGAELSVPDTWAWRPRPGSPALLIGSWNSPTRWEWFEWLAEEES